MEAVSKGKLYRISGPVVVAKGLAARMYDVVTVGKENLMGEVIQIDGDKVTIQVYEDTSGLKPGEVVLNTGKPLTVELGPGLLTSIYDGIQRPLMALQKKQGDFISRGATAPGLDQEKKWDFKTTMKVGDDAQPGDILGTVEETKGNVHKIMVPPNFKGGKIKSLNSGKFTVNDVIGKLSSGEELRLKHYWPVRSPRPVKEKLSPTVPLITGQRIFDALFPLAKGGAAAIPGPFGAGKCVTGDTPIWADGELKLIKDAFEESKGKIIKNDQETIVELDKPLKVYTFDGKSIKESNATYVYKGKTSKITEIKTKSGKSVRLTPIHKLFRIDENLKIVETESQNLQEGDYIVSPRLVQESFDYQELNIDFECRVTDKEIINQIPEIIDEYCDSKNITRKKFSQLIEVSEDTVNNFYYKRYKPTLFFVRTMSKLANKELQVKKIKTERKSKYITVPSYLSEDLAELLGYLLGDGMIKGKQSIHFFNKNRDLRQRVSDLILDLFGLETKEYYANTVEAIMIHSRPLVKFLESLGYPLTKKSRNAKLPKGLLKSPDSVIRSFLIGYINSDGHIGKRELEITTASKQMQTGLSYLLLRLGILHRSSTREINGKKYYRVFVTPREAVKILEFYEKDLYYNSSDVVPMNTKLFKDILEKEKPFSLEKQGLPTAGYYVDQNITTGNFQKMMTLLESELTCFANALDYIFCDKVVSVKTIDQEEDVYDVTVPETHNFIGGHLPMVLHNTVSQQQLAKWCNADIIVYVGCGERGNEMTEVLVEFPHLVDPRTDRPLLNRTVLIANTSNMPVAAREASVYTGITIAEYYRDQGFDVAMMADSTSRWAEAMREISSRLEEMPGEEGYPAYLATRLSEFYERAGRVIPKGTDDIGSVSVIGAVSPPGGDFSEPVTQNTLRVTKAFWALDAKLAQRRHFPSINWLTSYSLYNETLDPWYAENVASDWGSTLNEITTLLGEEDKLMEIVQLVGSDALPPKQQLLLEVARLFREFLLQQNAFHDVDTFCELDKTYMLMKTILLFNELGQNAMDRGARIDQLLAMKSKDEIGNAKFEKDYKKLLTSVQSKMKKEFEAILG